MLIHARLQILVLCFELVHLRLKRLIVLLHLKHLVKLSFMLGRHLLFKPCQDPFSRHYLVLKLHVLYLHRAKGRNLFLQHDSGLVFTGVTHERACTAVVLQNSLLFALGVARC